MKSKEVSGQTGSAATAKDATTKLSMTFSYGGVSITQPYPIKGPANPNAN